MRVPSRPGGAGPPLLLCPPGCKASASPFTSWTPRPPRERLMSALKATSALSSQDERAVECGHRRAHSRGAGAAPRWRWPPPACQRRHRSAGHLHHEHVQGRPEDWGAGRRRGEWPSGIQLRCFGAEQGFAFRPSACSLQKPGNPGRREMPPHARAPLRWSWRAAPRGRVRPTARPPARAVWPLTAGPGAPHRRPRPPSCPPQRPSLIAAWGRSAAPTSAWNLFLKELFKNHFFFPARDGGMPDHPGVAGRTSSPQGTARTAFIETLSRRDPRGRRARRRLTLASRIRRHYFS